MKTLALVLAIAVPAGMAAAQDAQTPAPAPTAAAAAAPGLVDDVIKLWKANLSEDFIKKYVAGSDAVKDLSAEDIIRLRSSGLPENLISTITDRKKALDAARTGAPAPTPSASSAPAPAAPAASAPSAAPVSPAPSAAAPAPAKPWAAEANRKWEGMVRRNGGVVVFKSRWDVGYFEFKEETIKWVDADEADKNLLVPIRQVTEFSMRCLKKAGGNECFEFGFKTKDDEYRFRDVAWQQNENAKAQEIYRFFKELYPNAVASEIPVDSK